jgi:hypothetical protein
MIAAELDPAATETRGRRGRFLMSPMLDLMGARELAPDETAALRRARGELVSAEDQESLFREWWGARRDEMRTEWEERARSAAQERLSEELGLSPGVEDQLSSFQLPLEDNTPYSLWQIQESVARATGLHIASDCFSHRAGWEWQDAGTFLRFRSRARDLWRAALLSPAATAYLDSWFDSQLAQVVVSKDRDSRMDVVFAAEWTSALAAGLTDLQFAHGGKLICGDPHDSETSYRQQLREAVLGALYPASEALRALNGLSDSQWQLLRDAGLRVAYDLTPDQRAAFNLGPRPREVSAEEVRRPGGRRRGSRRLGPGGRRGGGRGPRGPGGFGPGSLRLEDDREMSRLIMRIADESPYPARGRRGPGRGENDGQQGRPPRGRGWGRARATENDWLSFWVGDELRGALPLPRRLSVELASPESSPLLVPGATGGD